MKKRLIFFMSLMLMIIMVTGVVFATTQTEDKYVGSGEYDYDMTGTYTKLQAHGRNSSAIMSLKNTSSEGFYLIVQIREYDKDNGWTTNRSSSAAETAAGNYLWESITRDFELSGYYYYYGKCMDSANSPAVYDTLTLRVFQNQ